MSDIQSLSTIFRNLESKDITASELESFLEIEKLLQDLYTEEIKKRAVSCSENWSEKWAKKSEYDLTVYESELMKKQYASWQTFRLIFDHILREVMGYYGIGSPLSVDYRSLAYKIRKHVGKARGQALVKLVNGIMLLFIHKNSLDPKTVKVVVILASKTTFWFSFIESEKNV